jgi:hypothetical protein
MKTALPFIAILMALFQLITLWQGDYLTSVFCAIVASLCVICLFAYIYMHLGGFNNKEEERF